ncbi:ABC transporter permease [Microbacterium sp. 179-I 3D3 NHS]|uniref:ABC transporter permease n=1 Tax=Microbacterium sp. 179-I 3D3 NHS TaxID=3142382 RepID=UPI0039A23A8D
MTNSTTKSDGGHASTETNTIPLQQPRGAARLGLSILGLGPVLILLLLAIAMSIATPLFFTERNIQNVLLQSSVIALLGVGQLLVILTRGIDLSVGSIIGLSSVMGGMTATWSFANGLSVVLAIIVTGVVVGFLNGFLFVKGRIPHPFIVTLAMLSIVRGVALTLSGGSLYTDMPPVVLWAGQGYLGPVPVPALIVAVVAGIMWFLTTRTQWGRWIYLVGGNPEGARQVGVPVNKVLISVYVVSGLCAALAAIVSSGRTGTGDPNAGTGLELDAIAAVIIGGASFFGGRGSVGNVIVGALTIGVIRNGLDLIGVNSFLQLIIIGVVLLLAVLLDVFRTRLEGKLRLARSEKLA